MHSLLSAPPVPRVHPTLLPAAPYPAELRDFCARFTQSGADVSATAAVADFKCPFCRSVEPLSEREVCMQSMMIAIGPLFRANE